jgi:hypothetical protein
LWNHSAARDKPIAWKLADAFGARTYPSHRWDEIAGERGRRGHRRLPTT